MMQAYAVRLHPNQPHAREIVGIFVAPSLSHLFWMVDECCSPIECEYREIGSGGLFWDNYTGQTVPRSDQPDWENLVDDWSPLPPSPTMTDGWDSAFAFPQADQPEDGRDAEWVPLEWIEEAATVEEPQAAAALQSKSWRKPRRRRLP